MDTLSMTLSALAHPTRRSILAELSLGERTVTELAEPFDITMPAVTKHLKVLERAGVIERRQDAQRRPCRLTTVPLKEVADWLEPFRIDWEQRLHRLGDYLSELQSQEPEE